MSRRPERPERRAGSLRPPASLPPPTLAARLRALDPALSWSAARDLCRAGRVLVDGAVVTDPVFRPPLEAQIELAAATVVPEPQLLVHVDPDCVVALKPPGLLTVPFTGDEHDTLVALARVALRRREPGAAPTLRAVQRLDRECSGLVVFARTVAAQRVLQAQFAGHTALRRYQAIAHGRVEPAVFDSFLLRDRGDGRRGSWRPGPGKFEPPPGARHAVTMVESSAALRGASLLTCRLGTGRQHQIRIHLAEAGHPLLGERVYTRELEGPAIPAPRLMLHAGTLGFDHPRSGRALRFEAAPPADFLAVLSQLRGRPR